jgi:phosphatidylglycerol:prolipoprotein diacylglycerol transferase
VWPEIHRIWGVQFTLYDLMRGAAIAASLVTCLVLARRQGIPVRKTLLIAAACIPVSVAAARFLNVIEYGATWKNAGPEFWRNSGSSIYGALFACMGVLAALTRAMRIPTLPFLDAGAPGIALGEAISRIGCFCAGCCYGEAWNGPWAVVFPNTSFAAQDQRTRGLIDSTSSHSLAVHPVQLYGVVIMGLLTWVLARRFLRQHQKGHIFFWLLIGYGSYRLAITAVRVEALASMKVFSVIFISAGILGLVWSARARQPV